MLEDLAHDIDYVTMRHNLRLCAKPFSVKEHLGHEFRVVSLATPPLLVGFQLLGF
jgi:hypothetical protein